MMESGFDEPRPPKFPEWDRRTPEEVDGIGRALHVPSLVAREKLLQERNALVVLVTGGAGFIGSHIVDFLIDDGFQVVVLDDLSGGAARNVHHKAHLRVGSVADEVAVEALFMEFRPAYVVHAAAYAAEGLSHFIRRFNYENNLLGSVNLINAAVNHGVKGFVFLSSIAVYGHGFSAQGQRRPAVFDEEMTPAPCDPYGISKYAVEMDLRAAHEMFGLPFVIFRPHNVYGRRQNIADPYRNVIGIFMRQLLKGQPMTIFGDGQQRRAFSHITEVAAIISEAIDAPECWNDVYNVGGNKDYTVKELAWRVAEAMGVEFQVEHLPARNEVHCAVCDHSKARKMFGQLTREIDLPEGLKDMAAWVKGQPPGEMSAFGALEVSRKLPPSWAALARNLPSDHAAENPK